MSLAGLRDISVIETPPEGRRPVRTYVGPYDEELVGEALRREVRRKGQVFFLHNRIETLHDTAERLRALVPEASFLEAHGRLDEGELESTMLSFLRGDADVLVATTIIESGLDVPAANTLDRRARRPPRARSGLPDPRPGRPLSRARLRLHALPLRGGGDEGGGGAAGDARRPHRARLRVPDRDARPRAARRRRPARRRAVRPRRRDRLRALRRDARPGGRGAAGRRRGRADRGGGPRRHRRLRLRALLLRPLRGGQDRHPPADRRRPRARRAARPARRAPRPLRPAAGADRGAAGDPAGPDRAQPRRRHQPAAAGGADRRRAARPRFRARRPAARADPRGDLQLPRRQPDPARTPVPTLPTPSGSSGSTRWRMRSRHRGRRSARPLRSGLPGSAG